MSAVEVLKRAKELIEQGWTKGSFAKDSDGYTTNVSAGCAWCAEGAILLAGRQLCCRMEIAGAGQYLERVIPSPENPDDGAIPAWNDSPERTKEEVLSAFDRAIALAESV